MYTYARIYSSSLDTSGISLSLVRNLYNYNIVCIYLSVCASMHVCICMFSFFLFSFFQTDSKFFIHIQACFSYIYKHACMCNRECMYMYVRFFSQVFQRICTQCSCPSMEHARVHTCMYVCLHLGNTCMYVATHIYTRAHVQIRHLFSSVHTYIHTYIHTDLILEIMVAQFWRVFLLEWLYQVCVYVCV
jgi:hypothetical protein